MMELYSFFLRLFTLNTPRRFRGKENLTVNIGAGKTGKDGWINIDILSSPGVNCLFDCRRKLPFSDDSVKMLHCEHFLEHLDYTEEVPYFLSECFRVLQNGGILRVSVPDTKKYLRAYCENSWDELERIRPLEEGRYDKFLNCRYRTKMELINSVFRTGVYHKYSYDYKTLVFILQRYGFTRIERQEFGKSILADLCIDNELRAPESLYVEAVKIIEG
jgi:predicted SAM-dependent methyltransferase